MKVPKYIEYEERTIKVPKQIYEEVACPIQYQMVPQVRMQMQFTGYTAHQGTYPIGWQVGNQFRYGGKPPKPIRIWG